MWGLHILTSTNREILTSFHPHVPRIDPSRYGIPSSGPVKGSGIFLPSMDLLDKLLAVASRMEPHAHDRFRPFLTTIDSLINPGEVVIHGRRTLMFGSNNYFGLTNHPEVIAAAKHALDLYGSGTTGSRIANGTLAEHEAL